MAEYDGVDVIVDGRVKYHVHDGKVYRRVRLPRPGCPVMVWWDGIYKGRCDRGGSGLICGRHGSFVPEMHDVDVLLTLPPIPPIKFELPPINVPTIEETWRRLHVQMLADDLVRADLEARRRRPFPIIMGNL